MTKIWNTHFNTTVCTPASFWQNTDTSHTTNKAKIPSSPIHSGIRYPCLTEAALPIFISPLYIVGTPKIANGANRNVFLILLPPCEWLTLARTSRQPRISLKVCGDLFSQRLQFSKFAHSKLNTSTHRLCIMF